MIKEQLGTYRSGPYIFIEEGAIFQDEKGAFHITATYLDYNVITMRGMTNPKRRKRTFKINLDEKVLTYKGQVFPTKNLSEILNRVDELRFSRD